MYWSYPLFNRQISEVFGGAEVDLYLIAAKLAETGKYNVTFIVGDYGQPDVESYCGIRVVKHRYMNLERFKGFRYKVLRLALTWKMLLSVQGDLFFTETASELLGWMAIICRGIRNKRVVFRLGSDADADANYWSRQSRRELAIYRFGLRNSDLVISQTERQQNMLRSWMKLDSTIVKNGIDIPDDCSEVAKSHILWVSRAVDLKRPGLFLELAKRLPNESFVMIMPGTGTLSKEVQSIAENLANVEFIESVHYSEIQRYFNAAKLFVNTSEYEGFPNAFIQACLGATPILSFKVDPDGFITQNKIGLCCDDSINRAVAFICELDKESIEYFGSNAHAYVKTHHDLDAISQTYDEVFSELISRAH